MSKANFCPMQAKCKCEFGCRLAPDYDSECLRVLLERTWALMEEAHKAAADD